MPLDIIKLDRQLISGLLNDSGSRIIARSIISMLKALDYQVLAEGVEDEETAQLLLHYGCDQAQGYYFSRPFIADGVTAVAGGAAAATRRLNRDYSRCCRPARTCCCSSSSS